MVPTATAVAVDDGRIVAVGSLAEVKETLGAEPFHIDETFAQQVMLPGLIDQHLHPILGATTLATEVIATEDWVLPRRTFPAAHSHDEYVARLVAANGRMIAAGEDDTEWLFSWGYHQQWHGTLSRQILDGISSTRPIGVWQRSCHEFYMNSAALEILGITQDTLPADPAIRSTIDLDRGHFWERGFFTLGFRSVGQYLFSESRLRSGLAQMVEYLHHNGVTAFNEPGAVLARGAWKMYEEVLGADDVPFYSFFLTDGRGPAEAGSTREEAMARAAHDLARSPKGKVRFFGKQVKLFADGAIISQLMQMRDPYLDANGQPNPDHHGEWLMPPEVFAERFRWYWEDGYQIHIHVNGDLGLDLVLDTLDGCMADHPRQDHRTVLVHFANSTESQIDRVARLGAIVSANPYYPVGFADKFGEVGLGPERADLMVRSASVIQRKIPLSFHSDLPMGRSDPLGMMSHAVNRVTASGRVAAPAQRISNEAAFRAVTLDAAQSWQMETELGSIEPGKIANFTIVDEDPLEVDGASLETIDVLGTVFEGRWFPVAEDAPRRVGVAEARTSGAPLVPGTSHPFRCQQPKDHEGCECICSVAREAMKIVADLHRPAA